MIFISNAYFHVNEFNSNHIKLFVSIFALARIPGWTAQVTEQLDNNILIRPLLEYVGDLDIPYINIDER